MLGRETVVHQDDGRPDALGERAAEGVELRERTEGPAATVDVDDGAAAIALRQQGAHGEPRLASADRLVEDALHVRPRTVHCRERRADGPRIIRGHLVQRRSPANGELFEEGCGGRVERPRMDSRLRVSVSRT